MLLSLLGATVLDECLQATQDGYKVERWGSGKKSISKWISIWRCDSLLKELTRAEENRNR